MQIKASAKFIKISPKKVRLVVDAVRGMKVDKAIDTLKFMNKRATLPVMKLVNSAVANAKHNFELDEDNLFIKEVRIDEAPTLKRWMPRAHGRATTIRKRNSHINLVLAEIKDSGEKAGKKQVVEAPVKLGDMNKEVESKKSKVKSTTAKDEKTLPASPDVKAVDNKKEDVFGESVDKLEEVVKEINDPRREGRGGHARAEGGKKGFVSKIFRRKSG